MEMPDWAKIALELDGGGGATAFSLSGRLPDSPRTIWVHLDYSAGATRRWLEQQPAIPGAALDALLARETRPRAAELAGGLLVYLRGVNLSPDARPEDMIAVRLWIKDNLVISTQKRQLSTITELQDTLARGEGPRSPSNLVARLVDGLTWRMEEVIERVEDRVAEYSACLETSPDRALTHRISGLRRRAITLRRYLAPQREAIARLQGDARLTHTDGDTIREAGERLLRLLEDLDAAREHATLLQEQVFSIQNEAINDRMYLLAIVSALFLPLSFLTGLFGINVGGLPGVDNPDAFWWFAGALALFAAGVLGWMARRRWF